MKIFRISGNFVKFLVAQQLYMSSCFFFCLSHPSKYELTSPKTNSQVHIQTHKTILDLIWLNVLRNSCTVPYLFKFIPKKGKISACQIRSGQVRSENIRSKWTWHQVRSGPIGSDQFRSDQIRSDWIWSQIRSGQVRSGASWSQIMSDQIRSDEKGSS